MLSSFERTVLAATELDARQSFADVAKKIHSRPSRVMTCLHRLRERGIVRPRVFINEMALGLLDIKILFSLACPDERSREAVIKKMKETPGVAWLGSFAGDYQYGLVLFCPNLVSVNAFLEEIGEFNPSVFACRTINPQLEFTHIGREWGYTVGKKRKALGIKPVPKVFCPDDLDIAILAELGKDSYDSVRAVARALDETHVRVLRRIEKLEEGGVIDGYYYAVSGEALELETYRLVVSVTSPQASLRTKIREFALTHRWSVYLTETVGAWDYEIGFETPRAKEVIPIVNELYRLIGPNLREIKVLTELEELHSRYFPWTAKQFRKVSDSYSELKRVSAS